jgi:hypothetical protein
VQTSHPNMNMCSASTRCVLCAAPVLSVHEQLEGSITSSVSCACTRVILHAVPLLSVPVHTICISMCPFAFLTKLGSTLALQTAATPAAAAAAATISTSGTIAYITL